MNKILTKFNNLCHINIKNKKNIFNIQSILINKQSKIKLTKMKNLNLLNFKICNNNNIQIKLKLFENKFITKKQNKWN